MITRVAEQVEVGLRIQESSDWANIGCHERKGVSVSNKKCERTINVPIHKTAFARSLNLDQFPQSRWLDTEGETCSLESIEVRAGDSQVIQFSSLSVYISNV